MPFTGSDICKVCLVIPFTLLAQVSPNLIFFGFGSDPVRRPVAVAIVASGFLTTSCFFYP
jgi:hypothetical protein